MNTHLLIGVSARLHYPDTAGLLDRSNQGVWSKTVHYLEQNVARWVQSGGALAVLVPPDFGDATAKHYAQALDGLVLQGGNDVAPQHYGQSAQHDDWRGDAVRDVYEMALIRAFVAAGKPVFGICRGLQLINVAFGGTLIQDIPSQHPKGFPHRELGRYENHFHAIEFVAGTQLAALYPGQTGSTTNSIHHQGIQDLAPEFIAQAHCPEDGLIEALRWHGPSYVAGVQWHPEFHQAGNAKTLDDGPILRDFLNAVRKTKVAADQR
jgi:putative glutamine amidotransferase